MTRLAARSPAAPFQTSRPAPVSYDSDQARTRELKRLKARVDELEEEAKLLREAHMEIVRAIAAEQKNHNPEWPAMAGYAKGTAVRALNGHPPDSPSQRGDADA